MSSLKADQGSSSIKMVPSFFKTLTVAALLSIIGSKAGTVTPVYTVACKPYRFDKLYIGNREAKVVGDAFKLRLETSTNAHGGVDIFYTAENYQYIANVYPKEGSQAAYSSFYTQVLTPYAPFDYIFTITMKDVVKHVIIHVQNQHRCDYSTYLDPDKVKSIVAQAIVTKDLLPL